MLLHRGSTSTGGAGSPKHEAEVATQEAEQTGKIQQTSGMSCPFSTSRVITRPWHTPDLVLEAEAITRTQHTAVHERGDVFETVTLSENFFCGANVVNCAAPFGESRSL